MPQIFYLALLFLLLHPQLFGEARWLIDKQQTLNINNHGNNSRHALRAYHQGRW
jgi:hypothetical protein